MKRKGCEITVTGDKVNSASGNNDMDCETLPDANTGIDIGIGIDIDMIINEIRTAVAYKKHVAGITDAGRRKSASGDDGSAAEDSFMRRYPELAQCLNECNQYCRITKNRSLTSSIKIISLPVILIKKIIRKCVDWYLNPVIAQINIHNDSVNRLMNCIVDILKHDVVYRDGGS